MDKKLEMQKANDIESLRQIDYINKTKDLISKKSEVLGRKLTYHVTTFGCQMNARDSEKLSGILKAIGFIEIENEEEADFVIFNTCTVRDNANQRVYGRLGVLKSHKASNKDMKIALCGCMMQENSVIEKIKKSYKYVNLIFGTHNIFKFAELIYNMYTSDDLIVDIWEDTEKIVETLPVDRKYSFKSGVNIMFGCNNFCTYCIVPYVRGRERSRDAKEIIKEIEGLTVDGVKEVMLLGQNVNSYGNGLNDSISFPELLKEVEKIEGIERIRFMTSHPKDLSDELIEVIKNSKKICRHIHLPLQSGSSRILKEMNRRYTKESYLLLAEKIRQEIPDIAITTDIIVGFPGETEDDINETIDVINKVQYDGAFTFVYSKRTGTKAAAMENQVSEQFIKDNFDRVLNAVQETSKKRAMLKVGNIETALIEEINDHDSSMITGRLSNNLCVHVKGSPDLIGKIVNVKLNECAGFYYLGEII